MPCYRLVNTAIDGVATDPQAVLEDVVRFFGSDLLCYRAGDPEALVAAQRDAWDGPLAWAEDLAGSRFALAEGIMHVAQPRETLSAMGVHLRQITDPVALAALHSMTTLTGSAILALARFAGRGAPKRPGLQPMWTRISHRPMGEDEARLGGGQKRIDAQHAKGKLTARERLEVLARRGVVRRIRHVQDPSLHRFRHGEPRSIPAMA
jgi:hypothetical protein